MSGTQELLALGLSEKEVEVYLSALNLGSGTVLQISQRVGIPRTTVYSHVKTLITRGLMKGRDRFGKVYYESENPEKLKKIFEEQEREILRKKELLENLLPELESLYSLAKDRPSVRFFDYNRPDDLQKVREEIGRLRKQELINIFNYEKYGHYFSRSHVENILDNNISLKTLYIAKNKVVDLRIKKLLSKKNFSIKFLPEGKFGFLCEILVSDRYVYIAGTGGWLIISDPLFCHALHLLFEAMWGISEKVE